MMKTFQSIETRRTIIRRLIHADQEKLIELLCDPSVTNNMSFTEEMKTPTGATDLLAMTIKSYDTKVPLLAYAIEDAGTGEFIGVTGLNPLEEHNIEVFYALLPAHWHKGFASEVLNGLVDFIFKKEKYQAISAFITPNNLASARVAEKNGFVNRGLVKNPAFSKKVFLFQKENNNELDRK